MKNALSVLLSILLGVGFLVLLGVVVYELGKGPQLPGPNVDRNDHGVERPVEHGKP